MEKILFIGPVARQGGPAIKNSILVRYLEEVSSLQIQNTYDRSLKARAGAVLSILFTDRRYVIVAVSRKGRKLLYPFLLLKKKISGIRYACVVIGGEAVESLQSRACIEALKNADLVTAETRTLVREFRDTFRLENVHWMPNYKELPQRREEPSSREKEKDAVMKFLFLSSMRNAKGVRTLLEAFRTVIGQGYEASLDYYGPVKKDLDPGFLEEIEKTDHVRYCGMADNDQVLDVMEKYDVFVFPTEYTGEGFPAVLVEAQAAGLPVIASDMNYNAEIIRDGRNGWIYERGNVNELADRIRFCLDHREALSQVSENNLADARTYDAGTVIASFISRLRENEWPL